ncbi:MAG: IclR family transcriptional regulator [Anaerolineae bacterium]|nr:IclR family transcriptional regulator [Anaerolineae bacterium]
MTNLSVRRAITILEHLAEAQEPKELTAVSHDLAMNKSTVYRFLSTLAKAGYVRQESDTGRYALGPRVAWLAAKFLETVDIRQLARPILEELGRESGETIHLAILDQDEVVYIEKIDGRQAVQMVSRVGSRLPVHSTALGKVLLADLPESQWQRYISEVGLTAHTPNTIVVPEAFFEHLRQVQRQNYSIDNVENEEGVRCVAAPIRDHTRKTIAALSISGSTITMTPEKVESLVPLVQKGALTISERLGFNHPEERTPGTEDVRKREPSPIENLLAKV